MNLMKICCSVFWIKYLLRHRQIRRNNWASRTFNIMEDIRKYLQETLNSVDGLYYILITDRDSVPFVKVSHENAPDLENRLPSVWTFKSVADQANKWGIGATKAITTYYTKYQVIQIYSYPLILTFIAKVDANTGYILSLEKKFQFFLNEVKEIISERVS